MCVGTTHSGAGGGGGDPYSSCGRTMVLYAASRTPVCLVLMFVLIKPTD